MAVTPNFSWPVPVATDYVKDGWEAISDLGNAIDTTVAGLGSGLDLVSTATLTGSSGQVFTSLTAGTRYRIIGNLYGSSAGASVAFKFREGGTDKSASYYGGSFQVTPTTSGTGDLFNNAGITYIGPVSTSADDNLTFQLELFISPSQNNATITGMYFMGNSLNYCRFIGFTNTQMATCDGFNIYPLTGTLTGKISLFEYAI